MRLSFVTVVFGAELGLLRLQARSMARFVAPELVEDVIIFVNDVNSEKVQADIEKLRPLYGPHADKLKLFDGDDIFKSDAATRHTLRRFITENKLLAALRRQGGWHGFNGHFMQQAFKLLAWKVVGSEKIVLLDAKNVFCRKVEADWFFDHDRPRADLQKPQRLALRWLPASFHTFGMKFRPEDHRERMFTDFITPYPVTRSLLREACGAFEKHYLPVHVAFATKTRNTLLKSRFHYTEFMILNAYCIFKGSSPELEFSGDLVRPDTMFGSSNAGKIDAVLNRLAKGEVSILGVHSSAIPKFSHAQMHRLAHLIEGLGLAASDEALAVLFGEQQQYSSTGKSGPL